MRSHIFKYLDGYELEEETGIDLRKCSFTIGKNMGNMILLKCDDKSLETLKGDFEFCVQGTDLKEKFRNTIDLITYIRKNSRTDDKIYILYY